MLGGTLAVQDKASGQMIGRVGYIHPEGWPGVEKTWTLARRFWGRDLAMSPLTRSPRCRAKAGEAPSGSGFTSLNGVLALSAPRCTSTASAGLLHGVSAKISLYDPSGSSQLEGC